jgi:hypothetical protein
MYLFDPMVKNEYKIVKLVVNHGSSVQVQLVHGSIGR